VILKASQRSGTRNLAAHLLNARDNEHVELLDIRGCVADDDLTAALVEMDAQAQGTKCRKPLFSVSFNPPAHEDATLEQFEDAIKRVEKQFGLENQARALIIHVKQGRRHVHAVYSMIDQDRKKALEVKFYKNRLMEISRDLYREHKWEIPKGLQQDRREAKRKDQKIDRGMADNYTLAEKQQAERAGRKPQEYKKLIRELYEQADTRYAFEDSLAEKGLFLARGDKRPFCIVDATGDIQNLTKLAGRRVEQVREFLGDPSTLPTVEQVLEVLRQRAVAERFKRSLSELRERQARERNLYRKQLTEMQVQHRSQNDTLRRQQWRRTLEEERARAQRLRGGIIRFFDKLVTRVTGDETRTQKRIGREREDSRRRDLREKDELHRKQRHEREQLKWGLRELEQKHQKETDSLREAIVQDIEREDSLRDKLRSIDRSRSEEREQDGGREADSGRVAPSRADDRGPKLER
jgi:hypothetical protein